MRSLIAAKSSIFKESPPSTIAKPAVIINLIIFLLIAMIQLHPHPKQKSLPTMYDLPSEDPEEPGLPDEFHDYQPDLLTQTCRLPHYSPENYLIASDLNLYYDKKHTLWHKRPDWFLVLGVKRSTEIKKLRLSYVVWQEGVSPFLVVELASPGTKDEDLGLTPRKGENPPTKWEVYEQILQVPYYLIYDRYQNEFRGFVWRTGQYQELDLRSGRLWLEELGIGIGLWQGLYEGVEGLWLRFYDQLEWIPTPSERAAEEQERTNRAQQRAIAAERERDLAQESARVAEENARAAEENARVAQENARVAQESARAAEENARAAQESARAAEENARAAEENARAAEENARVAEENARAAEENARAAQAERDRERQDKELERQQREQAELELQKLRQKLQQLNIDPDMLSQ